LGAISFISILTVGLSVMQVQAGEAVSYVTEESNPVSDLAIIFNGKQKLVRSNGFISFDIDEGDHQVELLGGEALIEVNVFADNATTTGILAG
jgi:hypothetical protein